MGEISIWHNPRCSKSRQTLGLLVERGHEPRIVRYLEDPPSAEQIEQVLDMLALEPRALMRTKEATYKELGLADETDRATLIRAMADHPILIERPVVIRGARAVLGRPPDNVLGLLDS